MILICGMLFLVKCSSVFHLPELKFINPLPLNFSFGVEGLIFKERNIHRVVEFSGGGRITLVTLVVC